MSNENERKASLAERLFKGVAREVIGLCLVASGALLVSSAILGLVWLTVWLAQSVLALF